MNKNIIYSSLIDYCTSENYSAFNDFIDNEKEFAFEVAINHPNIQFKVFRDDVHKANSQEINNETVECSSCKQLQAELTKVNKRIDELEAFIKIRLLELNLWLLEG